jgi:hypothetical protein
MAMLPPDVVAKLAAALARVLVADLRTADTFNPEVNEEAVRVPKTDVGASISGGV